MALDHPISRVTSCRLDVKVTIHTLQYIMCIIHDCKIKSKQEDSPCLIDCYIHTEGKQTCIHVTQDLTRTQRN